MLVVTSAQRLYNQLQVPVAETNSARQRLLVVRHSVRLQVAAAVATRARHHDDRRQAHATLSWQLTQHPGHADVPVLDCRKQRCAVIRGRVHGWQPAQVPHNLRMPTSGSGTHSFVAHGAAHTSVNAPSGAGFTPSCGGSSHRYSTHPGARGTPPHARLRCRHRGFTGGSTCSSYSVRTMPALPDYAACATSESRRLAGQSGARQRKHPHRRRQAHVRRICATESSTHQFTLGHFVTCSRARAAATPDASGKVDSGRARRVCTMCLNRSSARRRSHRRCRSATPHRW